MSEKQPSSSWQPEAIAERLHTEAQPTKDVYGEGFRYRFGQVFELAIYPQSGALIFRTDTDELRMAGQMPPEIGEDGVVFTDTDGSSARFTLTPESGIAVATVVFVGTREAPESAVTPLPESSDGLVPQGTESTLTSDSSDSQGVSSETERKRVHLSGVVGRKPNYYETRRGTPVARFSVGQKDESGETTWHDVVAFNKWAQVVRDNLNKRDTVEGSFYPQQRKVKGKDGTIKTVQELYVGFLKKLDKS